MKIKDEIEFSISTDNNGQELTRCFYSNNEDKVLALIVENFNDSIEEPLYLQRSIDVSIPVPSEKNRTIISIWYSPNESPDNLSSIIQAYFEYKFPDLLSKENTIMSINDAGKLIVRLVKN